MFIFLHWLDFMELFTLNHSETINCFQHINLDIVLVNYIQCLALMSIQ